METLVEIIIRLIAGLIENKPARPRPGSIPPRYQSAPPPPGPVTPPSRAVVTAKMPSARRAVKRSATQRVAIAKPIVTKISPAPTPAPPPPKAVAHADSARQTATKIPAQSAATIRKWMSPATLKNQFLLTEILQPPLALRNAEHR